jgi:hypothetical protein
MSMNVGSVFDQNVFSSNVSPSPASNIPVRNPAGPMLYNPQALTQLKVPEVAYHWFYKINVPQRLLMG